MQVQRRSDKDCAKSGAILCVLEHLSQVYQSSLEGLDRYPGCVDPPNCTQMGLLAVALRVPPG